MKTKEIIIATKNKNKVTEIDQILRINGFCFLPMSEKGIVDDIIEDGDTLEANALIKARYLYKITREDVMSEDTGLEVAALNGQPGVHTARYAGDHRSASDNMDKLIKELDTKLDRSARFRTVICLIYNGKEYLFSGQVEGQIAKEKRGENGFGYDPIFIPNGYQHTFGELSEELKNTISHRKNALIELKNFIENNLI